MGRPSKGLRVQMSLRLPVDLADYVETLAATTRNTRNDVLVQIVARSRESQHERPPAR